MRIGVSLPFGYLAGALASRDEQLLAEAFGPPSACLELLRGHGADSIELGRINAKADPGEVRLAAAGVIDAGLGLTLHGYLPDPMAPGGFAALYPPLAPLAELLRAAGTRAVMVLHCHRGAAGEEEAELGEESAAFVQRLVSALDREGLPWRIALEITRNRGLADPGDTYEGLLAIAEHLEEEAAGFCWDLGHTHWNVLQGSLPASAPPAFLRRVIHTHLHDLSPEGQTHWPLTERRLPLGTYLGALSAAGYRGVYNLELYPSRWAAVRDVRESMLASLAILLEVDGREGKGP
ncbi:MAG: sugar phosphate isomerase/epimerase family protein [Patescibacteria group bacterium]